ncbi:alpha-L-fucosidase [uncultured Chitinophaga sp.]|uniref:alpha-L-fucosidase n=1 Tax=uncultured Chitinophaga sp. TaxID=339340 RepID=UPI0025D5592B|nr:alpha-L-fucosidase [uncultured Chitinophaga sp.]
MLALSSWTTSLYAQTPASKMDWWREARLGMFIHWGVYAVPAGVYHDKKVDGLGEWIMHDVSIPRDEYKTYAQSFNPTKYDPEKWVQLAKDAGMKYIVITSKHHDGFALFDAVGSDWNVVKASPYGKDLLKPLVEACRKQGMKLGFYYSQANDWYNPGGAAARGHWDKSQEGSMDEYIDKVAVPQVRQLLTEYGDVVELWWDVPTDMNKERADKLAELIKLQPNIITNDRLGGGHNGDITTPEQYIPATGIAGRDWETCMTMNDTWGFKTADNNWKSNTDLIRNLVDIASKGGNYLLNVGPTADGEFPQPIVDRLEAIGSWMKVNGNAIYGTTASPFKVLPWGRCTKVKTAKGTTLYFHVFQWPANGQLLVSGLKGKVKSASMLADGKMIKTKATEDGLLLTVPSQVPDKIASVIKVEITGTPEIAPYVIKPGTNGGFDLRAELAEIHNKQGEASASVEGPENNRNFGFWTSNTSWMSWNIKGANPGSYTLEAEVATPARRSEVVVETQGDARSYKISSTGDYNKYQKVNMGTITVLSKGVTEIRLKAAASNWNAINLRNLTLTRVK